MKKVIFHLGAHKTATTYLQNRLKQNDDTLRAHNIYYPGIGEMRKHFTYNINDAAPNEFTRKMLELRKTHTILLSDENMAGGVDDVLRLGRQYLQAGEKLARYSQIVETDQPVVFLALREYSSFVVSIYCEYLRHHPFIDFDTFARQYSASKFDWPTLIHELIAAVPKVQIYLWDFSHFSQMEELVLSAMTGLPEGSLKPLQGVQRESFSELAVHCIKALSDVIDLRNMKKILPALTATFPKGPEYPAYNPFPAEVIADSKARYRMDLKKIEERFANVVLLKPQSANAEPAA
jgi:hypothetical protein